MWTWVGSFPTPLAHAGGMKVRESHNTYKAAYQFADSVESGKKV
jgi:hypothetical protein